MSETDPETLSISDMIAGGTPVTKALRIYSRLTLEQMVELSGVFRMWLVAIENGSEPSADEVRRISAALE